MGSRNEFGWLASANVTFTTKSHRNFKPYPASPKGSRFLSVISLRESSASRSALRSE